MNYLAQRDFVEVEEANPRTAASARCDCNRVGGGMRWQPIISGFRAGPWILRFVIIMRFPPIDIQQRSRLAVPRGRLGWRGGGLEAPRAIIC